MKISENSTYKTCIPKPLGKFKEEKTRVYYKINLKSGHLIFKVTLKKKVHFCEYTENAFTKNFYFQEVS